MFPRQNIDFLNKKISKTNQNYKNTFECYCTGIMSKKFQKFGYEKGIWRDNFPREILEKIFLSRLSSLIWIETACYFFYGFPRFDDWIHVTLCWNDI